MKIRLVVLAVSSVFMTVHGGMDRTRFNIGTYRFGDKIPGFRTEQHVKELKEAGIDYVCSMRPGSDAEAFHRTLDLFEKYGVGCITEGGEHIGAGCPLGTGKRGAMREKQPPERYIKAAKKFRTHPALWGLDVCDEPSGVDFPYLGEAVQLVRRLYPDQFPYVNLFPLYARVATNSASLTTSQMGALSYKNYIDDYCRYVPLDYISFDIYPYAKVKPKGVPLFFENLRIVSDACLRTGKSLWVVGQVNTWWGHPQLPENSMRYQAYTAMSFGAECMVWACWTKGWWTNNVYSVTGEKTEVYDRVKRVNDELHRLGDEFMRYRRTDTHLIGYARHPAYIKGSGIETMDSLDNGYFRGVCADDGGPLLAATMVPRSQNVKGNAMFIFASDDPYDANPKQRTVRFIPPAGQAVAVFGGYGAVPFEKGSDGVYRIRLQSNQAALVTVK